MNTEPLEATAWTLLIIAILFILGYAVLFLVDLFRTPIAGRGLRITTRQKGVLGAMGAAVIPPLLVGVLMHSFSPYLLLAAAVPLGIFVALVSRWLRPASETRVRR